MTKPRLTELAKARVDAQTKQQLEQLTLAFTYQDEADTVRAALREFIQNHRHALPKRKRLTGALLRTSRIPVH